MRKAQSAMEFLLTYGWAILVVMVVGITMWQMGIFNIGGTVPPRVTGTNYQKPIDATLHFYAGNNHCNWDVGDCVDLDMVNGEPGPITLGAITITVNGYPSGDSCLPTGVIGQGEKYTIDCMGESTGGQILIAGDVATAEITIPYTVNIVGVTRTRTEVAIASGPVE